VDALRLIDAWPARHKAAGVADAGGTAAEHGDVAHRFAWGSVTKLLVGYATLIAAEEGALGLDEPAGPAGSTVRHLLAHASGLAWDSPQPLGRPGERRIYSNTGYLALAEHVAARTEMPFSEYLRAAVLEPLALEATLAGDAAGGMVGTLSDLLRFGREALAPTLIAAETLAEATSVQFPGLVGVLPGFGRQTPNDWGLGFELRDAKSPHWTGSGNSTETYGHFGSKPGSATFLWIDPERRLAAAALADESFGAWAAAAWPVLSDAILS
jgi:CubicO group peptidase (beta-lactamase class C family)